MFGKIINFEKMVNGIKICFEKKNLYIDIINNNIINFHDNIGKYDIDYTSLITDTFYQASKEDDYITLSFNKYKINVFDNSLFDVYSNGILIYHGINSNKEMNSELNYELMAKEGHKINSDDDNKPIRFTQYLNKDDYIYAMGERMSFLNRRGYFYENWNTDDPSAQNENYTKLYKSIPFYIIFNKSYQYGIFFDNHYHTYFDLGKTIYDELTVEADGGNFNLYFILGDNLKSIVSNYTYITGRIEMPQYFSLGHHQSRWSYNSKEEVLNLAKSFRTNKIKCDVIHLDIDYMDKYKVFTTNKENFSEFKEFIDELHSLGFKVVCIIDPGVKVEAKYDIYEDLVKNKMVATLNNEVYINEVWPGASVYPTFNDKKTRDFWSDRLKRLTDLGVDGIWNDMNEPASFKGPLPLDVDFALDKHKEIHNLYGHFMAEATYNGIKKHTSLRPFVITRACYSGTQKYSTIWTGDNQSLWHHLRMNVSQLASLGLSGFPYCGTDIGGFGGDTTNELISRWVEFASIVPLFRNHSAYGTRRQEPWTFTKETLEIYRKYTNLRYELIPYIYDLYYEASKSGLPLLRPVVLEYQFDENTYQLNDEIMLGENLLASPVVDEGVNKKLVYLPNGDWYDFYTNELYKEGYHIVDAPIDKMPLFVKASSILPKGNFTNHTASLNSIEFIIYKGASKYLHYQDDGESYDYQKGSYNLYEISHIDNKVVIKMLHNGYKIYEKIVFTYNNRSITITDYNKEYIIE